MFCFIICVRIVDNLWHLLQALQSLSNAALEHQMYVVVNLLEKETIDNSTLYYNTNIVFANNGTLIAK